MSFLPKKPFTSWPDHRKTAMVLAEEIFRWIARAERFQTLQEAHRALVRLRRQTDQMDEEMQRYVGPSEAASEGAGATACPVSHKKGA